MRVGNIELKLNVKFQFSVHTERSRLVGMRREGERPMKRAHTRLAAVASLELPYEASEMRGVRSIWGK